MRVLLQRVKAAISFGPFFSSTQRRWRERPSVSAKVRLQDLRTKDTQFDKLASRLRKLAVVLKLHDLMFRIKRSHYAPLQSMSRWRCLVGLDIRIGKYLRRHPHVFHIFTHPVRRNLCCRLSDGMMDLLTEEESIVRRLESEAVERIKRLIMMSFNGSLHVHSLRLARKELGLPEDFRESILRKRKDVFKLVGFETVELAEEIYYDEAEGKVEAQVEKWREREYTEKWLSESDTKFAFPINFPRGFRTVAEFKEKLMNWQRLDYEKPYERTRVIRPRTRSGISRYEKRAVGLLHELLSLTVEKTILVERLAHFREDFRMKVNVRELLLKHPGIFYISIKGEVHRVFLREAYGRGRLLEPNPIHDTRRKMMRLIWMKRRQLPDSPRNANDVKGKPLAVE